MPYRRIYRFLCVACVLMAHRPAFSVVPVATVERNSLIDPAANSVPIVLAVRKLGNDGHWYANFGYYAEGPQRVTYADGARLLKVDPATGDTTTIFEDSRGGIRDPQVSYDGKTILFSYRKGGTCSYNLYEVGVDGSGLTQLTDGPFDDIEPTYLPDGGIMFVSSRCKRWVNCWLTQVAVLYRCDADGKNIRQVSGNIEHDNTPWPLADGRILYQRWEYVDRSQVHYHHLWAMNPDGTGQMPYYGNLNPGILMIDAKPIPGTDSIVSLFSPGHGQREHAGQVAIVNPKLGPDAPEAVRFLHDAKDFRDPYPLSENAVLVARQHRVLLMDGQGGISEVFRLSDEDRAAGFECHEPRPIAARPKEPALPSRAKLDQTTGRLILANVYDGRNMAGIQPGEIKKLLVLESLPKPINYTGGMEPLSYGGTFTLERVLGTVPVEADGSAYFDVPAMRSILLVALDEQDMSVKRMQSFLSVQPGETMSCVGCHEQRTYTTMPAVQLQALSRAPSIIEPIAEVPDVFDFPRDIQPILDRYCASCHGYEKGPEGHRMAGRVILTGDRGPLYSHSYFTLSALREFSDGRNLPKSNYAPRALGSSASRLLQKLNGTHYGVQATEYERKIVRLWIDTGAPYPGTYAGLGSGMIGGYAENTIDRRDLEWPEILAAQSIIKTRCAACHTGPMQLPDTPSDDMPTPPWDIKYDDPRLHLSRHIVYNLSRPERSLQLLAPLAKEDGGLGACRDAGGVPVFRSKKDKDYRVLLAAIRETKRHLDDIKRFDMPGFQPRPEYIREMKRYGVLPEEFDSSAPVNPYKTDRAYWESLWWCPLEKVATVMDH
ncbi:MAG: PD40 domain-containing protein [Candidatus Hydrogenedentes bacterium]|nr:PD40 domain-containing protein [Candidatus Hydrogenedentota bacterium]